MGELLHCAIAWIGYLESFFHLKIPECRMERRRVCGTIREKRSKVDTKARWRWRRWGRWRRRGCKGADQSD